MKHSIYHLLLLSALVFSNFFVALRDASAQGRKSRPEESPATSRAQNKFATPLGEPSQRELTARERREQAYVKLLEGQRNYASARNRRFTDKALNDTRQAFQEATQLDPTLAEAHTALAEIAFYYLDDLQQAEREATTAVRIDRNNFGARRILSRIYTVKSNISKGNLDQPYADKAVIELREVTRLDANDAEALALLGEFHLAQGRQSEAIDAFKRWAAAPSPIDERFFQALTKRNLSSDTAAARLGETLLQGGRTAEGISAIRQALAGDPQNSTYLELLGRALETGGDRDTQAVITELRRITAADPANAAAVALLARAEVRAGRVDEAVAALREAIAKRADGDREQLTLRAELAQILADALRYDEGVAIYEELLKARGAGTAPLTSEREKRFATFLLQSIISLRRQAGQTREVLAAIERMRALLGSENPAADIQNVLFLREQRKGREALEAVRAARLKYPKEVAFVRLEAATLSDLGRVDEGASLLRSQLKGNADDYEDHLAIAGLYLEAARGTEAVAAARQALELAAPDDRPRELQALLLLSSAQERAGDAKGSEESLRRILAKEPNNATALNNLGYFLLERNERLSEALEIIQRAVRIEPTNASFLDSLGWAHFKLNQLEEAERYLSAAARRNHSSATINEHLGDLYQRRGKNPQARAAWQKALSLAVEPAQTARIKAKLNGKADK